MQKNNFCLLGNLVFIGLKLLNLIKKFYLIVL